MTIDKLYNKAIVELEKNNFKYDLTSNNNVIAIKVWWDGGEDWFGYYKYVCFEEGRTTCYSIINKEHVEVTKHQYFGSSDEFDNFIIELNKVRAKEEFKKECKDIYEVLKFIFPSNFINIIKTEKGFGICFTELKLNDIELLTKLKFYNLILKPFSHSLVVVECYNLSYFERDILPLLKSILLVKNKLDKIDFNQMRENNVKTLEFVIDKSIRENQHLLYELKNLLASLNKDCYTQIDSSDYKVKITLS